MTLEERLKLIGAGYTKDEIAAMEKPSEEKKEPEKKEEPKEGNDFSRILAEELARAIAATKKEPEKKEPEKKEPEKKEPEKKDPSDDEAIKQLVAEQLKAFFQPSMKVDPVTDLSDIAKRLFEVKIKEGEK